MATLRNINTNAMREYAQRLETYRTTYFEALQSLQRRINELDDMWDGDANAAFMERWREDIPKFNRMLQVLREYHDKLLEAADRYDATEENNRKIVQG